MLARSIYTFFILVFCVSCSSFQRSPVMLEGVVWQLNTIQSMDDSQYQPQENAFYKLQFVSDGRVFVQADCNHGQGTWMQEGANVRIGPVGMTKALCRPESLEMRFLRDLDYVRSFIIRNDKLFLATLADGAILEFDATSGSLDTPPVFHYQCENNDVVDVYFHNETIPPSAVLNFNQQRYVLNQAVSASGARYLNGDLEFWEKGGSAMLTSVAGTQNCELY